MRRCTFDGCHKKHKAMGLCSAHYQRSPESKKRRQTTEYRSRQYTAAVKYQTNNRFKHLLHIAKTRGLDVDITEEYYLHLRSMPCVYCDAALTPRGVGLDRKDNKRGYVVGNVFPACGHCNHLRGTLLTPTEMAVICEVLKVLREKLNVWDGVPLRKR